MPKPSWLVTVLKALQQYVLSSRNILPFVRNSAWLMLDKILRLALGLFVSAWVARYLGPSQYGELAYVLAYIAFFQAVATLGLDGIVVRDVSQNKDQANIVLGTVFALRLGAGTLCWVTAIGVMAWINGIDDRSVVLTALVGGSLIFQSADTVDLWFQSQSQSRLTVLSKLAAYLVSSGIKIALVLTGAPLAAFAAVITLDGLAAAIGLAIAYKRLPCGERWGRASVKARELLAECWPLILSGISIMIYMRIDQIMIKEILGTKKLGIYAAVLPLATLWQFIPMTLNSGLAPFVARKKAESDRVYMETLQRIFNAYAALGWLVCIPTAIFANLAVRMLYGSHYEEGALVVSIYVFTNLFINLGVGQLLWLLNEHRGVVSLWKTLAGAIVAILGNWLVIEKMGIVGVAVVSVLSQLVSAVLTNLIFSREIFKMQIQSMIWPFIKNRNIK